VIKGGPVSEAGKEVVKWNATRHGIRSPTQVVPGVEKVEDWKEQEPVRIQCFCSPMRQRHGLWDKVSR